MKKIARRFLVAIALIVGASIQSSAVAQMMPGLSMPMLLNSAAAPAAYTGPGDIVSGATHWYGLRAYNNTLANAGATTTPVIDVYGVTTTTSCTIYLKGDGTGGLDFSTAGAGGVGNQCLLGATTFCTVTNSSCKVSTIYDQVGTANLANGSQSKQPTLTFSCLNTSLPCMTLVGSSSQNLSGTITSISAPYAAAYVALRNSTGSGNVTMFSGRSSNGPNWSTSSTTTWNMYTCGATSVSSIGVSVFHAAYGGTTSAGAATITVDGSTTSTSSCALPQATQTTLIIGSDLQNNDYFNGQIAEAGIWSAIFSGLQITNMCHNQYGYWGTSTSC